MFYYISYFYSKKFKNGNRADTEKTTTIIIATIKDFFFIYITVKVF